MASKQSLRPSVLRYRIALISCMLGLWLAVKLVSGWVILSGSESSWVMRDAGNSFTVSATLFATVVLVAEFVMLMSAWIVPRTPLWQRLLLSVLVFAILSSTCNSWVLFNSLAWQD